MQRCKRSERGFTLIELLLVLAIIGFVAGVMTAIHSMSQSSRKTQVEAEVQPIQDMAEARLLKFSNELRWELVGHSCSKFDILSEDKYYNCTVGIKEGERVTYLNVECSQYWDGCRLARR